MNETNIHAMRNSISLALRLTAADLETCAKDTDYREIEKRLLDIYLNLKTLRNARKDAGKP